MEVDLRHVCFEGKRPSEGRRAFSHSTRRNLRHPHVRPLTTEPADGFVDWIIRRAGLDAGRYRHRPLLRRLPACLRTLKVHSTEEARELLKNRPDLLPAAISSLLIGVTEFFRDPPVFESVRTTILSNVAGMRGPLRVWSAACSTGEELYSLAILLAETRLLRHSFLLGTDCRPDAIARARAACYRSPALRLLEPRIRSKYFEAAGDSWRPLESLRRHVHWKVADLAESTEEGPWNIILWRNAAIYLNPEPAATTWTRLAGALMPNGFLIVGKAEWPPAGLSLLPVGRCIYRKIVP
jgi:chemotaxis methyl-accepting protein methylase